MMGIKVFIPISMGELIDKISILTLKEQRIKDPSKLKHVSHELQLLRDTLHGNFNEKILSRICLEVRALHEINKELWDIEDQLREIEAKGGPFKKKFTDLARQVYKKNDQRALLKWAINDMVGSDIVEEKDYVDYSGL